MNQLQWEDAVRNYEQDCRALKPVPPRSSLTAEEEWHCRILGGRMYTSLAPMIESDLAQRDALWVRKFARQPLVVFTTTMPGLVAARELFKPFAKLLFLLPHEWEAWTHVESRADSEYEFHVHHWSEMHMMKDDKAEYAQQQFPEADLKTLRLHEEGSLFGPLAGTGAAHLWQWNGRELELLEEEFSLYIY